MTDSITKVGWPLARLLIQFLPLALNRPYHANSVPARCRPSEWPAVSVTLPSPSLPSSVSPVAAVIADIMLPFQTRLAGDSHSGSASERAMRRRRQR